MKKINLTEIHKYDRFEVMGHTFRSLREVDDAVSVKSRSNRDLYDRRDVSVVEPKKPIAGIYVALIYEPYPCFDSSDCCCENRGYRNYFFSSTPFSMQDIDRLADLPHKMNCRYVHEEMPEWAAPAIYWKGDEFFNPLLATVEEG